MDVVVFLGSLVLAEAFSVHKGYLTLHARPQSLPPIESMLQCNSHIVLKAGITSFKDSNCMTCRGPESLLEVLASLIVVGAIEVA